MSRHPARVLVAEDNVLYRNGLVDALSPEFATVNVASTADEAVQCVERDPSFYDVVIMDQQFPLGSDGLAALEAIKRVNSGIQVIMLTGHGRLDKALAALKRGAYRYIYKSSDDSPDELIATVNVAYEVARISRDRSRLVVETDAWKSQCLGLSVMVALALASLLVIVLLMPPDRFKFAACIFVVLVVVLLFGWQRQPIRSFGLRLRTLVASLGVDIGAGNRGEDDAN